MLVIVMYHTILVQSNLVIPELPPAKFLKFWMRLTVHLISFFHHHCALLGTTLYLYHTGTVLEILIHVCRYFTVSILAQVPHIRNQNEPGSDYVLENSLVE